MSEEECERALELLRQAGMTGPQPDDEPDEPTTVEGGVRSGGPKHKQVRVRAGGQDHYVDEGIAPLLRECWRSGIQTVMSCQSRAGGRAWVEFESAADATMFLNAVGFPSDPDSSDPDPSLMRRAVAHDPSAPRSWVHRLTPLKFIADEASLQKCWVSLRFPPSDIPLITKRLTAHRKAAKTSKKGGAR